jgi:hypothetical protein
MTLQNTSYNKHKQKFVFMFVFVFVFVFVLSSYLLISSARFIKKFTISWFINASKSDLVISIIVVRTVVSMAHYWLIDYQYMISFSTNFFVHRYTSFRSECSSVGSGLPWASPVVGSIPGLHVYKKTFATHSELKHFSSKMNSKVHYMNRQN